MKLELDLPDNDAEEWVDDAGALPTSSVDRLRDSLRWLGSVGEIKVDGQDAAPALYGPEAHDLTSAHSSAVAEYQPVVNAEGEEPPAAEPTEDDKAREEAEKQAQKEAEEAAAPEAKAAPKKEKAAASA